MNNINVLFTEKKLLLKSSFAKKASRCGSPESVILQQYISLYPTYEISIHEIRRNVAQEHYKGLTYDYMRKYINTHEDKKNAPAVLAELEELIQISHCHSQKKRYPVIKKWFLEKYPAVLTFDLSQEKDEEPSADLSLEGAAA